MCAECRVPSAAHHDGILRIEVAATEKKIHSKIKEPVTNYRP